MVILYLSPGFLLGSLQAWHTVSPLLAGPGRVMCHGRSKGASHLERSQSWEPRHTPPPPQGSSRRGTESLKGIEDVLASGFHLVAEGNLVFHSSIPQVLPSRDLIFPIVLSWSPEGCSEITVDLPLPIFSSFFCKMQKIESHSLLLSLYQGLAFCRGWRPDASWFSVSSLKAKHSRLGQA